MKKKIKKYPRYKRRRQKNKHHIVNKCKGGRAVNENLLFMDVNRHNAWHFLFENKSFLDVIKLLVRCLGFKKHPDYLKAKELLDELELRNET